ncbi:hypothetical protein K2X85_02600 [bacterium]|nr:hypothetical protein [bacterium]
MNKPSLHGRLMVLALVLLLGTEMIRGESAGPLTLESLVVTPHVLAPRMKYSRPVPTDLGTRIDLVVQAHAGSPVQIQSVKIDGADPEALRQKGTIAWHSFKGLSDQPSMPANARRHFAWNGRRGDWGIGTEHLIEIQTNAGPATIPLRIEQPDLWISAITYLSSEDRVFPNRGIVHLANASKSDWKVSGVRLFTPADPSQWMVFDRLHPIFTWKTPSAENALLANDRLVIDFQAETLPLTYGLIAVDLAGADGKTRTVWGRTRIKREAFDISGGWVVSGSAFGLSVTYEPFLKMLKRIHVNTAHYQGTPGYSDQTGPDGLFTRYPLKYFHNLRPIEEYDREDLLPRVHAAEWLGEPQYPNPEDNESPQKVYDESANYSKSRLPTSVTLSDESTWRYYAGLTDFPHYDAYRVVAPHVDSWPKYERFRNKPIYWGSPLETIGDMTRSLRELSRPAPTAYWAQGPADGWKGFDGRRRRGPTPGELRSQAYHALANRITSLYWFNLSPRSLIKFRDTLDELGRVGREIRMLDHFYLEGDAIDYHVQPSPGALGWDVSTIASPRGALLFGLDLDYAVDTKERVFAFPEPRAVTFDFVLPGYLRGKDLDVWRVDADGAHDIEHENTDTGVRIRDVRSNVGIYVATPDRNLRAETAQRQQQLVQMEESLKFDPARNDQDFDLLARMIIKE